MSFGEKAQDVKHPGFGVRVTTEPDSTRKSGPLGLRHVATTMRALEGARQRKPTVTWKSGASAPR